MPEIKLAIAGKGPLNDKLRLRISELNLKDHRHLNILQEFHTTYFV